MTVTAIALCLTGAAAQAQSWDPAACEVVQDFVDLRRDLGLRATDAATASLLRDRDLLLRTLGEASPEALARIAPSLGRGIEAFELGAEEREVIRRLHNLLQERCAQEVP